MRLLPTSLRGSALAALSAALLATTAGLAWAQEVTVTDISVSHEPGFALNIPTIAASDTNLDEAAIRAMFSGDAGTVANLAGLDASRVHIPEFTLTFQAEAEGDAEPETVTLVYRDFEMRDVTDGVAASVALGGIEMRGEDDTVVTFGRMSSDHFDLGGVLAFYGLHERADDQMRPIYRDFLFEGATITSPQLTCEIGSATIEEFRARPVKVSFADLMNYAQQMETAEAAETPPSPEAIAGLLTYYADMLTAFESTPAELAGLECTGTSEDGKAVSVTAGPLTMGGFKPGTYPSVALDAFRLDIADGWMTLANATWKEMDLSGTLAALQSATAAFEAGETELDKDWFEANWRRLVPAMAGFSLSGFALDIPDEENPGQRIQVGIGAFDVSLANYVNGIPADIASSAANVTIALPPDGEAAILAALGFERLDLGYDLEARWDAAAETIHLDDFTITGSGLGTISLRGTIANATADLYSEDPDTATAAAMGLAITTLTIDLHDEGLLPILVALGAAEQGQPPAAFHGALTGMGTGLPVALLGPSPESIKLGGEVAAFLSGTPRLSVTLTARDPAGIGMVDFMQAEEDPSSLAGKIAVSATSSGEPRALVFPDLSGLPDASAAGDEEDEPASD